jgi:hypothetical protein
MQHIGIRLEGEGGGEIFKLDINFGNIVNVLNERSKEKYPWLWGIDPYGYTVFNLYQTPHVISELKQLSSEVKNEDLKLVINRAIDFISKIEQHTYIRLIGD